MKPHNFINDTINFGVIDELMPEYSEIPDKYKRGDTLANVLQSKWFYRGVSKSDFPPVKDGIDREIAIRHLAVIQASFKPKHEHKTAAIAYLLDQWFNFSEATEEQ